MAEPQVDPMLMTRSIMSAETTVIPTDLSRFSYHLNGKEITGAFVAQEGDEVEVRRRSESETPGTMFQVPCSGERRDRALYRLMLSIEDVLEETPSGDEDPVFDWARRAAADLRQHLGGKGYVV